MGITTVMWELLHRDTEKHAQGQTQKHMQDPGLPTPSVMSRRSGLSHAKEHNVFKSQQSKPIPSTRYKDSSMLYCVR